MIMMEFLNKKIFLAAFTLVFLLAACERFSVSVDPSSTLNTPQAFVARITNPSDTPGIATPALTETATAEPSPTPTTTLTPTPTLHPMSIPALRQGNYPGSDIGIVEELEQGLNYRRFYASYLSEGLTIFGLLTIPNGEMPTTGWPAIVFNHGYISPDQYRTTERYISYVDWLARSGYVIFRIDYRGHDRSEGEARSAYSEPGYTVDVLNALASLKRFPIVDPERIGMWGHSMGGFLTLRAMVVSPDIRAGVIWAGVVGSYPDLLTRWRRNSSTTPVATPSGFRGWRSSWTILYGSPEENPEFWNGVSANSYLRELSGPIQLHHGTADYSVPLELSEILAEQIEVTGGLVEFYTYEDDNHNLSTYFSEAMTRTIKFFDRYVKDIQQ
jgi:fermentation-respiration switch protein FrsA (DUF1100 family)